MDACLQITALKGIPAADEGSNFAFSPLSLVTTLSLIAEGARGETLRELLSFLGSSNVDHLRSVSAHLIQAIGTGDRELILSSVNGAWVDRCMTINPSFMEAAVSIYGAHIESVDFISQASLELKKINRWIDENTSGIIKDLIPNSSVDCSTKLILANPLYFKGKWLEKFNCSMTEYDNFYLLDGSIVQAPFMTSTKRRFVSSYKDFKVLRLPYMNEEDDPEKRRNSLNSRYLRFLGLPYVNRGEVLGNKSSFSLLLFLPNEMHGLHDLIKRANFDFNFILEHVPCFTAEVGQFMVPKFKISFNFEVSNELKHLGLKTLFNPLGANLSGFCLESLQLPISSIHHKVVIEVDEEGTTGVPEAGLILASNPSPVINFVADHPFMFVLIEDFTKSILLLGHVVNPLI